MGTRSCNRSSPSRAWASRRRRRTRCHRFPEWWPRNGHPVVIGLDSLRARCPITTVDPDTIARDPEVLRDIGRRFGGRIALNARVVRPGFVRVGDAVTLVT
ncbi:MAG: MOSC domain-containing protein [Gemmatimonadaceae bacterium]|nr:MOSC domain-containing protein [Gemmatimonadaceae bacterium]